MKNGWLSNSLSDADQLYQSGQAREAAGILESILNQSQDVTDAESEVLQLYGIVLHDLARHSEAADAIERAGLVTPLSAFARIALASSYAALGRTDLARDLFLRLAIKRNLSPGLMLEIAAGLESIDAPQLAMQVCQWITESDDSVAQAFYDMGYYSARSGQPLYMTEALTHRAMRLDRDNVQYRFGLVSLLIQLRREDEALAALGDLDERDVLRVSCKNCLERIAEMLRRHGRSRLADACERRRSRITPTERNLPCAGGVTNQHEARHRCPIFSRFTC